MRKIKKYISTFFKFYKKKSEQNTCPLKLSIRNFTVWKIVKYELASNSLTTRSSKVDRYLES